MIHSFDGQNADEVWFQVAKSFQQSDEWTEQSGERGPVFELSHCVLRIREPSERWITSRVPALNPAFVLAEIVWILNGKREAEFVRAFFPDIVDYVGDQPIYACAYGHRLRVHFQIDQLVRAMRVLTRKADTNQVVLQIWDPSLDLPKESGARSAPDVPCNISSMLKIRDGRLHWTQIMRSNDLLRGLPYNVVQFTTLQEVLAGWIGVEPGEYIHFADVVQVFDGDSELIMNAKNPRESLRTESLACTHATSERLFKSVYDRTMALIRCHNDKKEFLFRMAPDGLPQAFSNMFCILAAELARRNRWQDISESSAANCSDPALSDAWQRWYHRNSSSPNEKTSFCGSEFVR